MAQVSRTVRIAAPPERVFALVSDPARIAGMDPRAGGVRVERDGTGPRRVILEFAPGEGRASATIAADVVRWAPGREFALASSGSVAGPAFRLAVVCREADGGTDLTCEMELRFPGLAGRLTDRVVGATLAHQLAAMLAAVEREAVAPPGGRPEPTASASPRGPTAPARSATRSKRDRS